MPTHAHYAGEFGARPLTKALEKDPAYRAARAEHFANEAHAANAAHATAHAAGQKAEAGKHALVAAHAEKMAAKHTNAVVKLAPVSEHAANARAAHEGARTANAEIDARGKTPKLASSSDANALSRNARSESSIAKDADKGGHGSAGPSQPRETRAANNYRAANAHKEAAEAHRKEGNTTKANTHDAEARAHQDKGDKLSVRSSGESGGTKRTGITERVASLVKEQGMSIKEAVEHVKMRQHAEDRRENTRAAGGIDTGKSQAQRSAELESRQAEVASQRADTTTHGTGESIHEHGLAMYAHQRAATFHRDAGNTETAAHHDRKAEDHKAISDSFAQSQSKTAEAASKSATDAVGHEKAESAHLAAAREWGGRGDTKQAQKHEAIAEMHGKTALAHHLTGTANAASRQAKGSGATGDHVAAREAHLKAALAHTQAGKYSSMSVHEHGLASRLHSEKAVKHDIAAQPDLAQSRARIRDASSEKDKSFAQTLSNEANAKSARAKTSLQHYQAASAHESASDWHSKVGNSELANFHADKMHAHKTSAKKLG